MITATDFLLVQYYEVTNDLQLDELEYDYWVTARKQKIPVRELSTNHLNNIIKCLEGTGGSIIPAIWAGKTRATWLQVLNDELTKRV